MPFTDTFGRVVRKLRLSVTDRCNLRCRYCLPVEPTWLPRADLLTFEEIERFVRVVVPHGVDRLRLTGGEPLLRRDLAGLVERLAAIPGVDSLAMTTNGVGLDEHAKRLREAGLGAVTVSLDALDPEMYRELVKRDELGRVFAALDTARAVGLTPIKINTVVMRGVNEDQVERFAGMARERAMVVRFIEYMPLDSGGAWDMTQVVSGDELRRRISARWPLEPIARAGNDPATRWRFADGRGEIGFISSVTEPFCGSCDRIRLTADGKLLNCLFGKVEYDVRALLRGGASDQQIVALVQSAVQKKEAGHLINRPGFEQPRRVMSAIGG